VALEKTCTACNLPKDLEAFGPMATGKYGRKSRCKECLRNLGTLERAAKPQTEEQKVSARARAKAWSEANKERCAANAKSWAQANPEKTVAATRKWQLKNPEKTRASYKKWALANPDKVREATKKWREENADAFREMQRRWRTENQGYWRKRHGTVGYTSTFTLEDWDEILEWFGHRCAYCYRDDQKLTMDHVQPISKGGNHVAENIVPACKSCNSKKKDRPVFVMTELMNSRS
jgi:5-methylcytosine-specific restriction endonuclease McrA